eukprot:18703_1
MRLSLETVCIVQTVLLKEKGNIHCSQHIFSSCLNKSRDLVLRSKERIICPRLCFIRSSKADTFSSTNLFIASSSHRT